MGASVYAGVDLMRRTINAVLYLLGFRRYGCERGLVYWYRDARDNNKKDDVSTFLYFHGIAPGGHAPYVPMLLLGILTGRQSWKNRNVFLFENRPISYALCFDALTEDDTVHGVQEAI